MESQKDTGDKHKNENDDSRKIVVALLFLLLSCSCIFCSSQGALWAIDQDHVEASILSNRMADYGTDLGVAAAPLDGAALAAEVLRDDILLQQTVTTSGIGGDVVMVIPPALPSATPIPVAQLPTPIPTPTPTSEPPSSLPPTATALPTVEPSPTLAPTATDVPPTPVPTPTDILPTPTEPVPTLPSPTDVPTPVPPTNTPNPTSTNTPVPLPRVSFSAANYIVDEAAGTVAIDVNLSAASSNTVTVNYTTADGSASAPGDYTAAGNILLTFTPGQTTRTIIIPIVDDGADEFDETFIVTLSNPVNATLDAPNPVTVTIIDDDVPLVQFDNATYTVGEDQGPAVITVTLNIPSPVTVTVNYATGNSTPISAVAGSDYISVTGVLAFAPGDTIRTFAVSIINDAGQENSETLSLDLSNPTNAILGATNPATLTITDDGDVGLCQDIAYYPPVLDIGPPDCRYTLLGGDVITVTLPTPISVDGIDPTDFELVYYERESPTVGNIALDMVSIEVATSTTGIWYEVFNWGDGVPDTNTNIYQEGYGGPPEPNDPLIPLTSPPLYRSTPDGIASGIAMDLDSVVPPGTYSYVRLNGIPPVTGTAEVDSIEVLP